MTRRDEFTHGACWRNKTTDDLVYVERSTHTNPDFVLLIYGRTGRSRFITRRGLVRKYEPFGRAEP